MPRSALYPYLFLRRLHEQVSIPSGRSCSGLQSQHPFTEALPFRIWGTCPQSPCSGSGKHVPCYTGSWWSPKRYISPESDFSICPSEKRKSAAQHSQFASKHLPQIWAWLGRSLDSSISSFLTPFPPAWLPSHFRLHGIFLLTTRGHRAGKNPSLSDHPYFKCLFGTSYVTSCTASPMMCYFCQFPHIFYLLWLPSLVRGRIPHYTGASASPSYVTSH